MIDKERQIIEESYKKISKMFPEFGSKITLEEFLTSYLLISSRQFSVYVNGASQICLVPYADFADCGEYCEENADWDYDAETKCFQYKAISNITKGDPVIQTNSQILINYGHKTNLLYFTYYGFTFDNPMYDSIGLVFYFDSSISNAELKKKLIYVEPYGFKIKKFHADFGHYKSSNGRFMEFCRFYWSDQKPEVLIDVFIIELQSVSPKVGNIKKIKPIKRKANMKLKGIERERTVLNNLLKIARSTLELYPTSIEVPYYIDHRMIMKR